MLKTLAATAAVVLASTTLSLAQTTEPGQEADRPPAAKSERATPTPEKKPGDEAAKPSDAKEAVVTTQRSDQLRADAVIGSRATNPGGDDLGKIEDLLLDEDKRVSAYVVSVGGFLGIGSKSVAIAADKAELAPGEDGKGYVLTVNMPKEALEDAPAFKTKEDMEREAELEAAEERRRQQPGGMPAPGTSRQPR